MFVEFGNKTKPSNFQEILRINQYEIYKIDTWGDLHTTCVFKRLLLDKTTLWKRIQLMTTIINTWKRAGSEGEAEVAEEIGVGQAEVEEATKVKEVCEIWNTSKMGFAIVY